MWLPPQSAFTRSKCCNRIESVWIFWPILHRITHQYGVVLSPIWVGNSSSCSMPWLSRYSSELFFYWDRLLTALISFTHLILFDPPSSCVTRFDHISATYFFTSICSIKLSCVILRNCSFDITFLLSIFKENVCSLNAFFEYTGRYLLFFSIIFVQNSKTLLLVLSTTFLFQSCSYKILAFD